MKDRLVGMMGTLGLALLLAAAIPPAEAFASGGKHGCKGTCRQAHANAGECEPSGHNGCNGIGTNNKVCCPSTQVNGECPCGRD